MLELIEKTTRKAKDGCYIYICRCKCGNLTEIASTKFNKNRIQSCGCLRGKAGIHHYTKHPLFSRYKSMISRCTKPTCRGYATYGGRGIKVCDRWMELMPLGFENFIADMGNCPNGYSLERVDNSGDYSPDNCKWASNIAQSRNKRNNRVVVINKVSKPLCEWADEFNCSTHRVKVGHLTFKDDYDTIKEYCSSNLYITVFKRSIE